MPIYTDKKTGRLYIEFQYRGYRYKERMPDGATLEESKKREAVLKLPLKPTFVYFIADRKGESFKIGISTNPQKRFQALQNSTAIKLELVGFRPGNRDLERNLHDHFYPYRLRGEWFWSSDIDRAFHLFSIWNDEIQKLAAKLYMADRLQRNPKRLKDRWQEATQQF